MKEELKKYLKENLVVEKKRMSFAKMLFKEDECEEYDRCDKCSSANTNNINEYINQNKDLNDFQTTLFKLIDTKNLKDSDVYNKVNMDRRLFSKIRSDNTYHPSKETVILLGIALELNENDFEDLLASASYYLPKNNYFDLIIRFCIINKIFKVTEINELLMEYKCKLLNC